MTSKNPNLSVTSLHELPPFYASECYGNYGVFTRAGYQIGGFWPSLELAEQAAQLANKVKET
jgi:hypothetical protein